MTQERQISLAPWIEAAFKQRAVSEAFFCYTSDSLKVKITVITKIVKQFFFTVNVFLSGMTRFV